MRSLLLALLLAAATPAAAEEIALSLANDGAKALRCQIIFAHWVTADLPTAAPNGRIDFSVQRDTATRELYVPREPDGRRMMLEGVLCGGDDDWNATLTLLDLEIVKRAAERAFERRCAIDGALACSGWKPN